VRRPRLRSAAKTLGKGLAYAIAALLLLLGAALLVIETGWAKDRLRELIVREANQYLTATLEIGRLEGSLFRGLRLGAIRLSRDGQPMITIDEVALSYSLRELWQEGTTIRQITLIRPHIVAAKLPDGRWDLGALIRRDRQQGPRQGPGRPIQVLGIEVVDGRVQVREPLRFGAAHVPTDYQGLNAIFAFTYRPVSWAVDFSRAAFVGREPDLTVTTLSGGIGSGPDGWVFDDLAVETSRSKFVFSGRLDRTVDPSLLDIRVRAERFAFQEWSGIIRGLQHIAIEAAFDTHLRGPRSRLATSLQLQGTGGSVNGDLTLDTTVPGWRGAGALEVARLDLARWLDKPARPSDITGRVVFDLDLNLGSFPRGSFSFDGAHAAFMGYEADNVRAEGTLTDTEARIDRLRGVAYGSTVTAGAASSIGLDAPYPFRFEGTMANLDLRRVPPSIPVPRVESTLSMRYEVTGQFDDAHIVARAVFSPSVFLGAGLADGFVGTIDTAADPVAYTAEGDVSELDVNRFGQGLDVAWMRSPRYAGTLSGRFHVQGAGGSAARLVLTGGGRLARAEMFQGTLSDADVTIAVADGSLEAAYKGRVARVNPAVAFDDPQFAASLTGTVDLRARVADLLLRTTELPDFDVTAAAMLEASTVRGIPLDTAAFSGALRDGMLRIDDLQASGPAVAGRVTGAMALREAGTSDMAFDVSLIDFERVKELSGLDARGTLSTTGRLTGPYAALRAAGTGTISRLDALGLEALTANGDYDVTIPSGDVSRAQASVAGRAAFVSALGLSFQEIAGTATMAAERIGFDAKLTQVEGRSGNVEGHVVLRTDRRSLEVSDLTLMLGGAPWRLSRGGVPPVVSWGEGTIAITPAVFAGGDAGTQRVEVSGTWRSSGGGALKISGRQVYLETLEGALERPARFAGLLDVDAVVSGTRDMPVVTGDLTIVNGRVQRLNYEKLVGRVGYADGVFDVDLRLDQAPGSWLTASGRVPYSLFSSGAPDRSMDVAIASSPIELGLIEGLTEAVADVSGSLAVNLRALGTGRDPHFDGAVDVAGAAFVVTATGAQYRNVRADVDFAADRVIVNALHVEDRDGHSLDVEGSLATHELKVGELQIDAVAREFELLRNEYGEIEADAQLQLRGRFESPRLAGRITISDGDLNVDMILERALFQPYATEETAAIAEVEVDPVAVLNPWERLGLDIELHVPNTLTLSGENVQITTGTPIGLGDINLRVLGDLYVYKDPGQPAYVTGSLDQVSGRYAFQGRNFDVDPTSSINFRGDLNPEIYVTVRREISGVETRVTIAGPMREPELRLASTPTLDTADILSLIVFNTSSNELSAAQQQELAVRAGALAAGFLAAPIISAVQSELGLDILQIEPGTGPLSGPRITVGDEIAPGLVARFSRQFGTEPYDEVVVEYYLSRILRLRATFSDAQNLGARAPFLRRERAGIDLLLFFSF
jgi:autotransporter translocation and assembly factor TamB